MKKSASPREKKTAAAHRGPRYSLCLDDDLFDRIQKLPRLEKRRLPNKLRALVRVALEEWNKKQPAGRTLKLTP